MVQKKETHGSVVPSPPPMLPTHLTLGRLEGLSNILDNWTVSLVFLAMVI